jgi:hypothetical protein
VDSGRRHTLSTKYWQDNFVAAEERNSFTSSVAQQQQLVHVLGLLRQASSERHQHNFDPDAPSNGRSDSSRSNELVLLLECVTILAR